MQLVAVMAVRKAVSTATITFALILLVALAVLRKHVLAIVLDEFVHLRDHPLEPLRIVVDDGRAWMGNRAIVRFG